jgi:hypothetical protein
MARQHYLRGRGRRRHRRRCHFRLLMLRTISFNFYSVFSRVWSRTNVRLSPLPILFFLLAAIVRSPGSYIHINTNKSLGVCPLFFCIHIHTYTMYTMTFFSFFIATLPRHHPYSKVYCIRVLYKTCRYRRKITGSQYNISPMIFTRLPLLHWTKSNSNWLGCGAFY